MLKSQPHSERGFAAPTGHKSAMAGIMCFTGEERGTSSRCPVCGHRQKPKGRVWVCKSCVFTGHRDVVGAANMHPIAYGSEIEFPYKITYLRPGPLRGAGSGMNNRSLCEAGT
ncbi:MAG: zinc ribbon domain-containing protein [Thermacetogeniaceae bacterium]